jgi:hypothetical protein
MFKVRKQGKPLLKKSDKLVCHVIELGNISIGVDVAEAGANRVIDEEKVREFVPGAIVILEMVTVFQPIWTNFHHGTVLGTAAWTTIKPDDGSLPIGDVLILEMPEEKIAIVFWGDFDVSV